MYLYSLYCILYCTSGGSWVIRFKDFTSYLWLHHNVKFYTHKSSDVHMQILYRQECVPTNKTFMQKCSLTKTARKWKHSLTKKRRIRILPATRIDSVLLAKKRSMLLRVSFKAAIPNRRSVPRRVLKQVLGRTQKDFDFCFRSVLASSHNFSLKHAQMTVLSLFIRSII